MSEQELYMMTDERGKDEFSTDNLIKKHERLQTDINGYADTIRELGERSQGLIEEGAPYRYRKSTLFLSYQLFFDF